MNKTSVLQILAFLAHFFIVSGRRQELVLYTESNFTGLNQTFYENELNLQSHSFGKIAKSLCVRSGLWRIAGMINGETSFDGWTSANIGEICSSWNIKNQTAIYTSIRRVSGSDLDKPYLSLYSAPNFRGTAVHVVGNHSDLFPFNTFPVASVAFTGTRDWNTFPASDFLGQAHCLEAQELFGHPVDVSFYTPLKLRVGSLTLDCPRQQRPLREGRLPKNAFTQPVQITTWDEGKEMSFQLSTTVGSYLVGNTQVTGKGSSLVHLPALNHLSNLI